MELILIIILLILLFGGGFGYLPRWLLHPRWWLWHRRIARSYPNRRSDRVAAPRRRIPQRLLRPLDQVLPRDRVGLISSASFNQGSVRSRAPGSHNSRFRQTRVAR